MEGGRDLGLGDSDRREVAVPEAAFELADGTVFLTCAVVVADGAREYWRAKPSATVLVSSRYDLPGVRAVMLDMLPSPLTAGDSFLDDIADVALGPVYLSL